MTEERFTLININEQYISANIYDNGVFIASIGFGEELVVELLNSLNDENEQLKSDCTVLVCSNQEYRKENEQLKESNERFSKTVAEQIIMIKEYREENEQLKNEINMLKTTIARNESYIKRITETSVWSN